LLFQSTVQRLSVLDSSYLLGGVWSLLRWTFGWLHVCLEPVFNGEMELATTIPSPLCVLACELKRALFPCLLIIVSRPYVLKKNLPPHMFGEYYYHLTCVLKKTLLPHMFGENLSTHTFEENSPTSHFWRKLITSHVRRKTYHLTCSEKLNTSHVLKKAQHLTCSGNAQHITKTHTKKRFLHFDFLS
jgi:hypothetical protein